MKENKKSSVFATRLRHLRQMKNKTQKDCATVFNCTDVAYGSWERGEREPSLEKIVQICEYFNESADWLLGVNIDAEKEQADMERTRAELDKFHLLKDKLHELLGEI